MLETYFWQKNAGSYLAFKNKATIDSNTRNKIIALVVDFLFETYGDDLTLLEKCITAFATVTLFPALKYKNSRDGTVSGVHCTMCNVIKLIKQYEIGYFRIFFWVIMAILHVELNM